MTTARPAKPEGLICSSSAAPRVRCVGVVQEAYDARTLVLERANGAPLHFKPGQHLLVSVEIDGRPATRAYSIVSSPTALNRVTVTVKRIPGGLVSNWLHDHFGRGDELIAEEPTGGFNFVGLPSDKPLMLSGGSGVTPVMSMLRWLRDKGTGVNLGFVHSSARTAGGRHHLRRRARSDRGGRAPP